MTHLPDALDCTCPLCRPGGASDAWEAETAAVVARHGWMVTVVGAGGCDCGDCDGSDGPDDQDDQPAFAYTIGLWHQARHPELLMSGQRGPLMHRALNAAARGVMRGHRLVPGMTLENVIGRFPVLVDQVSEQGLAETVLGAHHFHHRVMEAVQLVWPDTNGVWGWQPGAAGFASQLQPQAWRVPALRTGAVAVDPEWAMPLPPDALVVVCTCVQREGAPVLRVVRKSPQHGEVWQLLCGEPHRGSPARFLRASHLSHLVRSAPSVLELSDLPAGQQAVRTDVWSPWVRGPIDPYQRLSNPVPPRRRSRR